MGGLSAVFVDGDPFHVGVFPFVPVPPQRHEHIEEISPLVSESVLVAGRVILVGDRFEDAVGDQGLQPICEHVAGNLQVLLEVTKATHSEEDVSHDEQCPAITDDIDGAGNDTVEMVNGFLRRHKVTVAK